MKAVPKIKGKWLEVMRKARALIAATIAEQAAKDAIDSASSEFLNADARVVHEEYVQIFGITGKVIKELGDSVLFRIHGNPISHKVRKDSIELLSYLSKPLVPKALNLNKGDKEILFCEFPDLCNHASEGLQMNGMASGDHLKLCWWIIQRDLIEVQGACLADPIIIYQISHGLQEKSEESMEIVKKAGCILLRQFHKAGLLGVPVWADEHWTLLVFRKVGKVVHVRYYDSLKIPSSTSAAVADYILQFIRERCTVDFEFPLVVPEKNNTRSWQINGVDCAFFAAYFWEGECRSWIGEGWSMKFPTTSGKGVIYKMRARVISLITQMQKIPAEREKAMAKAKVALKEVTPAAADADEVYNLEEELFAVKKITKENLKLASLEELEKMAAASKNKAAVPFYGCSKCRYNRKGCINYKCHPLKFEARFVKFPEFYAEGTKTFLNAEFIKMSAKDLIGGGKHLFTRFPIDETRLCAHSHKKNKQTNQHTNTQTQVYT